MLNTFYINVSSLASFYYTPLLTAIKYPLKYTRLKHSHSKTKLWDKRQGIAKSGSYCILDHSSDIDSFGNPFFVATVLVSPNRESMMSINKSTLSAGQTLWGIAFTITNTSVKMPSEIN